MDQPPPISEITPPAPPPPSPPGTSLAARLLNIFATPGDVFEEVKAALPSVGNWLVPVIIYGLMTAVASVLVLSQPAIAQKIHEKQEKVFDDQVKAGTSAPHRLQFRAEDLHLASSFG